MLLDDNLKKNTKTENKEKRTLTRLDSHFISVKEPSNRLKVNEVSKKRRSSFSLFKKKEVIEIISKNETEHIYNELWFNSIISNKDVGKIGIIPKKFINTFPNDVEIKVLNILKKKDEEIKQELIDHQPNFKIKKSTINSYDQYSKLATKKLTEDEKKNELKSVFEKLKEKKNKQ
jgi:hypothetical protein